MTTKKRPFWQSVILWAVERWYLILFCLVLCYCVFVPAFGTNYSIGQREGILQKYSVKGLIWKTGEGELVLPNFKVSTNNGKTSGGNELFKFSASSVKDFSHLVGHAVRVYYREALHRPYSDGMSNYHVDSIVVIKQ